MKRRNYTISIRANDTQHVETRAYLAGETVRLDFVEGGVYVHPQLLDGVSQTATLRAVEGIDFPLPPKAYGEALWTCRCVKDNGQRRKYTADVDYCGQCDTFRPRNLSERGPV